MGGLPHGTWTARSDRPWGPSNFICSGYYRPPQSSRSVKLNTHVHLLPRLRIRGAYLFSTILLLGQAQEQHCHCWTFSSLSFQLTRAESPQHARQRPSPFVSPHSTSVSGTELSLRRLIIFYVRKHFFRLTSGRLRTVRRIFVEDKRDYTVQYPVIVHSNGFCVVYGWHMTDDYSYMKICIKNSRHIEMVCTEILCN